MFETQYNEEMEAEARRTEAAQAAGKIRVGFVGLGIMGGAMANNLQKAGYALAVYQIPP